MALYVNTNVSSLTAQIRLNKSTKSLNKSYDKLSSGSELIRLKTMQQVFKFQIK